MYINIVASTNWRREVTGPRRRMRKKKIHRMAYAFVKKKSDGVCLQTDGACLLLWFGGTQVGGQRWSAKGGGGCHDRPPLGCTPLVAHMNPGEAQGSQGTPQETPGTSAMTGGGGGECHDRPPLGCPNPCHKAYVGGKVGSRPAYVWRIHGVYLAHTQVAICAQLACPHPAWGSKPSEII